MLESKDHYQNIYASGALDLTFAQGNRGRRVANVKSAPLDNDGNRKATPKFLISANGGH
jgi:hypothetical protein